MSALADVVNLFTNKFTRLRRGRLSLFLRSTSPIDRFSFRHKPNQVRSSLITRKSSCDESTSPDYFTACIKNTSNSSQLNDDPDLPWL